MARNRRYHRAWTGWNGTKARCVTSSTTTKPVNRTPLPGRNGSNGPFIFNVITLRSKYLNLKIHSEMDKTPTDLIPRRLFDTWNRLHNRDQTDRTEKENNGETPKEANGSKTRETYLNSRRFTPPDLDRQIRKPRPTMKELFTVRKAIGFIRILATFVFGFAMINMMIVLLTGSYDEGSRIGFLRFGMTVPASLCVMCNAISVFLLSYLIENVYNRKWPDQG